MNMIDGGTWNETHTHANPHKATNTERDAEDKDTGGPKNQEVKENNLGIKEYTQD